MGEESHVFLPLLLSFKDLLMATAEKKGAQISSRGGPWAEVWEEHPWGICSLNPQQRAAQMTHDLRWLCDVVLKWWQLCMDVALWSKWSQHKCRLRLKGRRTQAMSNNLMCVIHKVTWSFVSAFPESNGSWKDLVTSYFETLCKWCVHIN